ncbi:hypothetical protein CPC08DRAFT_760988 [Agrocybe pediades]|nr:hypothetical protein CPC08DRAFT_760988 [Agrocybe pediades]
MAFQWLESNCWQVLHALIIRCLFITFAQYERLTLTRFTALYFLCAVITGILLSSFHAASLAHDSEAAAVLDGVISDSEYAKGVTRLQGNTIELCSGVPGTSGTTCAPVFTFDAKDLRVNGREEVDVRDEDDDDDDEEDEDEDEDDDDDDHHHKDHHTEDDTILQTISIPSPSSSSSQPTTTLSVPITSSAVTSSATRSPTAPTSTTSLLAVSTTVSTPRPTPSAVFSTDSAELSSTCIVSLRWLKSTLHDAQREDLVAFFFSIWLFVLSIVTLLNESIPHLGAALLGHMLGTAWAAYRVYFIRQLRDRYRGQIVPDACGGTDFMGGWWEDITKDVIPLAAINGAAVLAFAYLSFMLFRVYARQTFKRVGASSKVHKIYMLVLVFSVFIQLSCFMSLASSATWIDKVSAGTLSRHASHTKVYLAAFIVTLLLQIPWTILGWISVRKEARIKFIVFCLISAILLAVSILMFTSDVYRYIFSNWAFFAAITVTNFIFLVGSIVLGALCRRHFGQGLAPYLEANDELEDANFTPVFFEKHDKFKAIEECDSPTLGKYGLTYLTLPQLTARKGRARGSSIYSDPSASPILISASPPDVGLVSTDSDSASGFSRVLKTLSIHSGVSSKSEKQGTSSDNLRVPPVSFPARLRTSMASITGSSNAQPESETALRFSTLTSTDISSVQFNTRRESTSTHSSHSKRSVKQGGRPGLPTNPRAGRTSVPDNA